MNVNFIALSIPIFFILILIELSYSFYKKLGYYRLNDSISNLSQGTGQQVVEIFMKTALFFGYSYIYAHWRFFTIETSLLVWILLFIAVDFFYYWFHRMSHQVNALWAAHIVHHQSEEYNLTVALRQSWIQGWFSWIFYLPLAFLGFDPILFLTISSFVTLYQFWIHTKSIKSLGFLELIFNTPSHHRVHHGSNPKYIDKNHAGTLIIWDKLFGTFQKEEEEVYFGITKPLASWNPIWANLHYWNELIVTASKTPGVKDKIKLFFMPPGWLPLSMGGRQFAPEIDPDNYFKYNPGYSKLLPAYLIVQFIVGLAGGSLLIFFSAQLESVQLIFGAIYVIITLLSCGALLEEKQWSFYLEIFRIISGLLIVPLFKLTEYFDVVIVVLIFNLIWYLYIYLKKYKNENQQIT